MLKKRASKSKGGIYPVSFKIKAIKRVERGEGELPVARDIGFEEYIAAIENGKLLEVVQNPSSNHPSQKMFVIKIEGYAYCVPFTETAETVFLKTVFPSRRMTELYLAENKNEES